MLSEVLGALMVGRPNAMINVTVWSAPLLSDYPSVAARGHQIVLLAWSREATRTRPRSARSGHCGLTIAIGHRETAAQVGPPEQLAHRGKCGVSPSGLVDVFNLQMLFDRLIGPSM